MERAVMSQKENTATTDIVLCILPENKVTPFVTWERNKETGATYWGHYFATLEEAQQDFLKR